MDALLAWALGCFAEAPVYWTGIVVWAVGFALYVPTALGLGRDRLAAVATALCWLGFLLTVGAHLRSGAGAPALNFDSSLLDPVFWSQTDTQIWTLWIGGSLLAIGSWSGVLGRRAWWLGLCVAMVGVFASWPRVEAERSTVLAAGSAVVAVVFLAMLLRGQLGRAPVAPGDYEKKLVRVCGSRYRANKLIREERRRQPMLSRAGAALALVTRLRHEKDGYPPPL